MKRKQEAAAHHGMAVADASDQLLEEEPCLQKEKQPAIIREQHLDLEHPSRA